MPYIRYVPPMEEVPVDYDRDFLHAALDAVLDEINALRASGDPPLPSRSISDVLWNARTKAHARREK